MSLTLHEQLMTVHIPLHHVRQAYVKITWYVIYVIGSWLHNPDHMLWLKIVEDQFTVTQIIKICVNAGFTAVVQLESGALTRHQYLLRFFFMSVYYSYQSLLQLPVIVNDNNRCYTVSCFNSPLYNNLHCIL